MDSIKIFLWPVIISIVGHALLIWAGSVIDLRNPARTAEIFNVKMTDPDEIAQPGQKEALRSENDPDERASDDNDDAVREDTVNLGNADVKYARYLSQFKKKISRIWMYPADAFERREEGVTVVKISVEADGSLTGLLLLSSSGSERLDQSTLATVREAAPFYPLPEAYRLTRLHIIASFRYRLTD